MAIMHFATTAERLRFLRKPKQEVKPVEVKKEDSKFEEKPKKKKSSKKETEQKPEKKTENKEKK